MATTILSGRSLTLTIATIQYAEQILDSAINFDNCYSRIQRTNIRLCYQL